MKFLRVFIGAHLLINVMYAMQECSTEYVANGVKRISWIASTGSLRPCVKWTMYIDLATMVVSKRRKVKLAKYSVKQFYCNVPVEDDYMLLYLYKRLEKRFKTKNHILTGY